MAPQARLLVNNALPYARNRVLDHPKAPKTALARPLGHPNRFARPLLDRPLVWWSGKPNRSPECSLSSTRLSQQSGGTSRCVMSSEALVAGGEAKRSFSVHSPILQRLKRGNAPAAAGAASILDGANVCFCTQNVHSTHLLAIRPSINCLLTTCLPVCLSTCQLVCLSTCPPVCMST
jgi:hypothetical protein